VNLVKIVESSLGQILNGIDVWCGGGEIRAHTGPCCLRSPAMRRPPSRAGTAGRLPPGLGPWATLESQALPAHCVGYGPGHTESGPEAICLIAEQAVSFRCASPRSSAGGRVPTCIHISGAEAGGNSSPGLRHCCFFAADPVSWRRPEPSWAFARKGRPRLMPPCRSGLQMLSNVLSPGFERQGVGQLQFQARSRRAVGPAVLEQGAVR